MESRKKDILQVALWALPVVVPLAMILLSFILHKWYWGLMDDATILRGVAHPLTGFWGYFCGLCRWGIFRPTFVLHSAFLYTIFQDAPQLFYIAKWVEIVSMLAVWGVLAYRATEKPLTSFLFGAIALSFHYFYDAFFFLSSQEILGLIFCGISLHLFFSMLTSVSNIISWRNGILGVFFLIVAFGAKEPFIACGVALGLAGLIAGRFIPSIGRRIWQWSIVILIISLCYGISVKTLLRGSYTAHFSFFDIGKISGNFQSWIKKDLLNHIPWIAAATFLFALSIRKLSWRVFASRYSDKEAYGALLGVLLYCSFLFILLPWNTLSYYAGPLGIFFAFAAAVLLTRELHKANILIQVSAIIGSLLLNILVCQYALARESVYNYDTRNLMEWVRNNADFQAASRQRMVFSNADEPSGAIPAHLNRSYGLNVSDFKIASLAEDMPAEAFYVFSRRFGSDIPDRNRGWCAVFYSKNWQIYRKEK